MSVAIRLRRAGARNNPFYHVVAIDSRKAREGKFLEKLGHYDPTVKPIRFEINQERFAYWVGVGGIASTTVSQLVAKLSKRDVAEPKAASGE